MLKKLIGDLFVVFLLFSNITVYASDKGEMMKESLEKIGHDYQIFLNFAGSHAANSSSIDAETSTLFAENFKKIVNNQETVKGKEKLAPYLWGFREALGKWEINVNPHSLVSLSDDYSYVTITYTVGTIDAIDPLNLIVIAILKIDANHKIVEIFEVDHRLK